MPNPSQTTPITAKLANFGSSLTFEDLPPEAVEATKNLCLDFLGVALNGSTTPSSRSVLGAMQRLGRAWDRSEGGYGGGSAVFGSSLRAFPEYAALVNGTSGHSIELDDVNNESSLHPGVAVFPAAFAMADSQRIDGKSFITAAALGYDVMVRLGRALKASEHYRHGFHPTGTCGVFGAASVVSSILGLDQEGHARALGIAGSQTAGSLEFLTDGSWTKRLHPGWAAHSGLLAALMAREGFLGPGSIIEGKNGFLNSYSDNPDHDLVLRDLGEIFHVSRTSVKPHSCCRYNQGPIDCVLDISKNYEVHPQDVEQVTVGVLSAGFDIVAAPEQLKQNPVSVVDEQFSMPFGAAIAMLYGRASLSEYQQDVAQRQEVKELMGKVRCVKDEVLDAAFPKQWPAWVEVRTKDGRTLRSEATYPKGDPENALTSLELEQKFRGLSSAVLTEERQTDIINTIQKLETLGDITELAELATA